MRRSLGFTLLELMLVLAIAALVLGIALPLMSSALPGVQLNGSARELAATLRYARSRAMATDTEVVVHLDLDQREVGLTGSTKTIHIPQGLEITLDTAQSELTGDRSGAIRFYPQGSSTGGRITLLQGERQLRVDVDWLTGRVRLSKMELKGHGS